MRLRRTGSGGEPPDRSGGLPLGSDVAALIAPLLDPSAPVPSALAFPIRALCAPERAETDSLVCVGPRTRLSIREAWSVPGTARPALILAETGVHLPPGGPPALRARSIHAALAALLSAWEGRWDREVPFSPGEENRIAPSAVVEGCLEGGVEVGPGAYIASGAFIGRGSRIGANAVIEAHCRIGRDCVIQPGAVIGCAGFGFYLAPRTPPASRPPAEAGTRSNGTAPVAAGSPPTGPGPLAAASPLTGPAPVAALDLSPMPHPAGVLIGDGCFIGANTVVAAGVLHPTALGRGCKLDTHVQIAHNVVLGDGCLLASQSGLAGSTVAGDRLRLGGAASVDGHLRLGNGVTVAACSGVTKDLPDGAVVAGFPARPISDWRKSALARPGSTGPSRMRPGGPPG